MRFLGRALFYAALLAYFGATAGFIIGASRGIEFSHVGAQGDETPTGSDGAPPPKPEPSSSPPRRAPDAPPQTTIIWISIDGLRHDYVAKAKTPTFDRCMETAAWSSKAVPAFPSVTFPSHASLCTGVAADRHGITGNSFYDKADKEIYKFPSGPSLLLAEPIWLTTTRQGLRTCAYDWPFSQRQDGRPLRSTYYHDRFDASLKADERFAQLANTWRDDRGESPLRLLMSYASAVDKAGHRYGLSAPETMAAVAEVDAAIGTLLDRATRHFDTLRREGDELFLIVTTDHGMAPIKEYVNLSATLGAKLAREVVVAKSGNLAHIFVQPALASRSEEILRRCEAKLKTVGGNTVYRRDELPPHWAFAHPTRTGDAVVLFDYGITINEASPRARSPIPTNATLLGMHGYPPEETEDMWGFTLFWRYPTPLENPGELGKIHALQIHPTVCHLLGISPAPGATAEPLHIN